MRDRPLIATLFGYSPQMRILNYLLDFPTSDFTKKETIQALGMSKQTFYKYFDGLEETGMVKVISRHRPKIFPHFFYTLILIQVDV